MQGRTQSKMTQKTQMIWIYEVCLNNQISWAGVKNPCFLD